MPKKQSKLNRLKQTHAKEETYETTNLDQVWGFNEISRYGTIDEQEYSNRLREMTRADLENHARGVGAIVVEDSTRLKESLLKQFRAYVLSIRKPISVGNTPQKPSDAYKKIMAEGK